MRKQRYSPWTCTWIWSEISHACTAQKFSYMWKIGLPIQNIVFGNSSTTVCIFGVIPSIHTVNHKLHTVLHTLFICTLFSSRLNTAETQSSSAPTPSSQLFIVYVYLLKNDVCTCTRIKKKLSATVTEPHEVRRTPFILSHASHGE